MPERASNTTPVQLLPVTMPGPSAPALGEWHSRGRCIGENPEVFFPSHGNPGTRARQVCATCQVRDECLNYATAADELGIWGGLDQQERRNLKRRQQRRNATARPKGISAAGTA